MMASSYNAKDEDGHITVSGPGGATLRSKKPENTAFKQQRLPAWQPILTAGTVLPAFFIIGLIFIPIGIGLYVTSNNIKEFEVPLHVRSGPVPWDAWINHVTLVIPQRRSVMMLFPVELAWILRPLTPNSIQKLCNLFWPCILAVFHVSCNVTSTCIDTLRPTG